MRDPQIIEKHITEYSQPLDLIRFIILSIMLVAAPLFWGGNRPLPLMMLELAAVVLLISAFWRQQALGQHNKAVRITAVVIMLMPLLYLLPVPFSLFDQLPGRAEYVIALSLVGVDDGWRPLSVYPLVTEYAWLTLLVPMAIFFTVLTIPHVYRKHLIKIVLIMAAFQSVLGLIQYGDGPESIYRLGNPNYLDSAVGTYPNRNHLAGLLEMALPIALGLFAATLGQRRNSDPWRRHLARFGQFRMNAALLYGSIALVILLGLIFTRSRAGLALAILAIFLCLIAYARRLGGNHSVGIVGTFAFVGVGLAGLVGLAPVLQRFTQQDALTDVRWRLFATSIEAIGKFFPLGSGPGTYSYVYPQFQPIDLTTHFINHAHNDYLEWLVEGGLIAAVLIIVFITLYFYQWSKVWTRQRWNKYRFVQVGSGIGILLIMLHSLVDFNLHIPANMMYFALLAAIFFSCEPEDKEQIIRSLPKRSVRTAPIIEESTYQSPRPKGVAVKNPFEE